MENRPLIVQLLVAPLLGAAFVLFLPFIGFYLTGKAIYLKLRAGVV